MKILVLNAGSSTARYEVFDLEQSTSLIAGIVERIGEGGSAPDDHSAAFESIVERLKEHGIDETCLDAVGHRVVHGGGTFTGPTRIDSTVIEEIEALVPLAPLHNPPNLAGIAAARAAFPGIPHVAVFDTAFHTTMPDVARRYALPTDLANRYGICRYGFHGTSYSYIATQAADLLGVDTDDVNLIALHLGNGASACAIERGRSVDTTMGFTPLEGLVMGTRSGNVDPSVVLHLIDAGHSTDAVDDVLNQKSGLKGLCGYSDMREVMAQVAADDEPAKAAVALYCYRIRQVIGAYVATLGSVDALVFAGGVGEHRTEIRQQVCEGLDHLGFALDAERNAAIAGEDGFIDTGTESTRILVISSNEALEIARQCAHC
jgi:acetate kinase